MQEIIQELKSRLAGEVRFDPVSRTLYSTDASIYEITPIGVVVPKCKADLAAIVETADKYEVPIIARGGGTSIVGNSIGEGIVIDCSKYLNNLLEVNREESWARVEPGIVLDQLNLHLQRHGLLFGPDVASSSRATVGGMIGNNSSGAHSIVYGKTVDHVLELDVVLSNGKPTRLGPLTAGEWAVQTNGSDLLGSCYAKVEGIIRQNRDEIERRFPKILRRVAGYNLDEFVRAQHRNLARIITGSEGTLAVVTEAKLNLVPLARHKTLAAVHFKSLSEALTAVAPILEFEPAALELLDRNVVDMTRDKREFSSRLTFVDGFPEALLLVEFQGNDRAEVVARVEKLAEYVHRRKIGYATFKAIEESQQADVWYIRKAGLGLLLGSKAARKPIGFVEDSAVAPEKLPEYIRRFDEIVRSHGTDAAYYAHASVGCLHIRPKLDLKQAADVATMAAIAEEVSSLALEFGGTISGEHGDGIAHSCWNEKMFGTQIYQAFRAVKTAFDPKNILNPGKVVDAPFMTEHLRAPFRESLRVIEPFFGYHEEGSFEKAIEICNGNGFCRKQSGGTMCPSYMVTHEEEHSTRGRANALRAFITGKMDPKDFASKRLYEILDLCISCKACKGECPASVDMAKLKSEFLYHYHNARGLRLRDRLFGHIATLNKLGCSTATAANWITGLPPVRWLLHELLGVHCGRKLPPFATETLEQWFRRRLNPAMPGRPGVVFFHDTFVNYNYPEIGKAAVKLLELAGYDVILPDKKCCGRPFISKGMLEEAGNQAAFNLERLSPYVERGYPIVGLEPSCVLTFREEYPDLLQDARVHTLAKATFLFEEFMQEPERQSRLRPHFVRPEKSFLLHGHCHLKALVGMEPTLALLRLLPDVQVECVDSGCCGMAGSFGFEKEHYQISMAMGRRVLFEAIERKSDDWDVVAPGVSCRQQIEHATGRKAKHPVQVLAEHLLTK